MSEQQAAPAHCEHHYETHLLGGHPISVRVCLFCRTPDWTDLQEQAVQLYRWGRDDELAGRPPRTTLSAYDMPRDAAPAADWERQRKRAAQAEKERTVLGQAAVGCQQRAWDAEAAITRVRALAARWQTSVRTGEPHPAATAVLAALDAVLPDPAAGPTVPECAANDRRWWGGEKTGEGQ